MLPVYVGSVHIASKLCETVLTNLKRLCTTVLHLLLCELVQFANKQQPTRKLCYFDCCTLTEIIHIVM